VWSAAVGHRGRYSLTDLVRSGCRPARLKLEEDDGRDASAATEAQVKHLLVRTSARRLDAVRRQCAEAKKSPK